LLLMLIAGPGNWPGGAEAARLEISRVLNAAAQQIKAIGRRCRQRRCEIIVAKHERARERPVKRNVVGGVIADDRFRSGTLVPVIWGAVLQRAVCALLVRPAVRGIVAPQAAGRERAHAEGLDIVGRRIRAAFGRAVELCEDAVGSPNPIAPGKVPKYSSKDRFSCVKITTCLISVIPLIIGVPTIIVKFYPLYAERYSNYSTFAWLFLFGIHYQAPFSTGRPAQRSPLNVVVNN
jgi:hypothetical protein